MQGWSMTLMRLGFLAGVVWVAIVTLAFPAYAYLDPGTGSMIVQGLIGAVAGGLVAVKLYWRRIRLLFSPSAKDGIDQNSPPRAESE